MQILVDQAPVDSAVEEVTESGRRLVGEASRDERVAGIETRQPPLGSLREPVELRGRLPIEGAEQAPDHLAGFENGDRGEPPAGVEAFQEQGVCRGVGRQQPHRTLAIPMPQGQVLVARFGMWPGELERRLSPAT